MPDALPAQNELPANYLETIETVAKVASAKFRRKFPDMSEDDLLQECRLLCWELIQSGKYDPSRPFGPFAFHHCRNRLLNQLRNRVFRYEPACKRCASGEPCKNGDPCDTHRRWLERNQQKRNIISLGKNIEFVNAENEPNVCVRPKGGDSELAQLIDEHLPLDLRKLYLRMLAGEKVPIADRVVIQHAVQQILDDHSLPVPPAEDEIDGSVIPHKIADKVRIEESRAAWSETTKKIDALAQGGLAGPARTLGNLG